MAFEVRRVVTGFNAAGQPATMSDGVPPHLVEAPNGTAVVDLWALEGPPADPSAGLDPKGGFPIEPPPGGMWWRIIRLPLPDQSLPREQQFLHQAHDDRFSAARPGMHATNTLDLMTVVSGEIELEVENGCVRLGPGDCVVQRGTQHRWRVVGDGPCTYAVALFGVDPHALPVRDGLAPRAGAFDRPGPRRIVTGVDAAGRSIIVADGPAPNASRFGGGAMALADLWQTGGALCSPLQGGDRDPWKPQLEPVGMGIGWMFGEQRAPVAGVDPGAHRTRTIDCNLVLEGRAVLDLGGEQSVEVGAGDIVVQRGTAHQWRMVGDAPLRTIAIMIGAPMGGEPTR